MKKSKIMKILVVVLSIFIITGCTTTLKDPKTKKVVTYEDEKVKITLNENILCKPTNDGLVKEYNKYKKQIDISKLPDCDKFKPSDANYNNLWETLVVKPLAWLTLKIGSLVKSYGIALIILSIIIRLILAPFTKKTALMLVHKLGFSIDSIIDITKDLMAPAGRMEMIKYNTNSVFVDYAHTPDAVINVLRSANEYKKGRIITIIGCGGDRDRTKRPIMGRAAEENSDYVIFTDDNPRTEDEKQIMNDIVTGLNKNNHEIIFDRKDAIMKGMQMLKNNDILMILGKGHEDYQIIGKKKIHFSDKEIVKKFLNL